MSPAQPDGQPWDPHGLLLPQLTEASVNRPLSIYVHIPFCQVRCGYCDFNTYTVGFGPGADRVSYDSSALAEMRLAARILSDAQMPARPASSIFFGGGTPTLLDPAALARLLEGIRQNFGIAPGAEVTVEANPESVDEAVLESLREAGFTRVSFGMQSAVPTVLRTLDRRHDPTKLPGLVLAARQLGLDVSVDLIYGAPGESLQDWEVSLREAIAMEPDHISAYALVIEEGTKMGAQVARGELPMPDPDDEASKYEIADRKLDTSGMRSLILPGGNREKKAPRPSFVMPRNTTLPIGVTGIGGGSDPEHTHMSVATAGGMSSIPLPMRNALLRGFPPRRQVKFLMRKHEKWNVFCLQCAPAKAWTRLALGQSATLSFKRSRLWPRKASSSQHPLPKAARSSLFRDVYWRIT